MEHRLQGKGGPAGLLGSWGPHPWLCEAAGQQGHYPRWPASRVLTVDKLRGSWVPSLAVCTSSGKPESDKPQGQHQHLEDAYGATQGHSRQGKGCEQCTTHAGSRLPTGNLHPAGGTHQGWAREGTAASTGARPGFSHQRAALSLQAVQAWRDGQQGTTRYPKPTSATRLHALAARQWGQPQLPAQGQDLQEECVGGRSVVLDS